MFKPKLIDQDQKTNPKVNQFEVIPPAVLQHQLSNYLPNPDISSMHQTSKKLMGIFQLKMDTIKALKYVVEGNVTAPRGQTYYNVSSYMLIKFLCDEDMLKEIIARIPKDFEQICHDQDSLLGNGGADLVKLDFNPLLLTSDDFHKIVQFKTSLTSGTVPINFNFSLLENTDGVLYWLDNKHVVNFTMQIVALKL